MTHSGKSRDRKSQKKDSAKEILPFLPPQDYRGRRNEPAYVALVAEKLADVRGLAFEEICAQTTANAERLFHGI